MIKRRWQRSLIWASLFSFTLPSYFRTDAAIFYKRDRFRTALNIRNLFDVESYVSDFGSSDFVGRGTPFTIQGSLSWEF